MMLEKTEKEMPLIASGINNYKQYDDDDFFTLISILLPLRWSILFKRVTTS